MIEAIGLDFGTTNTVAALADGTGGSELIDFQSKQASGPTFRSALCFWEDSGVPGGVDSEAGPWAIEEFLDTPSDCRFVQSFKSVVASPFFERALIFNRPFRFEDMGQLFLSKLVVHAHGKLDQRPRRVIVGRPVEYAGAQPDSDLARERYRAMFADFGVEVHYVYEPLGAAFSYATRLTEPATVLVADVGGGTTDFSIVRIADAGAPQRCTPLASSGIGIAGDRFDQRIVDRLVLPMLGKGGQYRSFDKLLDIPGGWFSEFSDWSRLALMRNRRTLDELRRLQRNAVDPTAIGRLIALIEHEQGYPLYAAVGQLKRALSDQESAEFRFEGGGLGIAAEVERAEFEAWIAPDLARIEQALDQALQRAELAPEEIDRVFLTGGSSLIPAVRAIFGRRFGVERIASGDELTSIAHGLAMIGALPEPELWAA
ncbi:Hsp70 family protein [Erythrobacter sp. T5W1-R]|uniref:Hsp70 family protein n=1 Tax=Erythrobacter sp. T5W1-R TaxID=3101752 RepID=UPI002AFEEBE5|nr:Hsp70 family protein [Erythrobacter sp. T5W1-R]MEA1618023.1 Hsp70 family protein [Erythrobacter sp. T5W1-R]